MCEIVGSSDLTSPEGPAATSRNGGQIAQVAKSMRVLGTWVGGSARYRKSFPATSCGLDRFPLRMLRCAESEHAFGFSCPDVHAYMSVFPDDRIPWSGGALLLNPRHDQMRRTGSERGQPRANEDSRIRDSCLVFLSEPTNSGSDRRGASVVLLLRVTARRVRATAQGLAGIDISRIRSFRSITCSLSMACRRLLLEEH